MKKRKTDLGLTRAKASADLMEGIDRRHGIKRVLRTNAARVEASSRISEEVRKQVLQAVGLTENEWQEIAQSITDA